MLGHTLFLAAATLAWADEPKTEVTDYTAFSKLLHKLVTANLPKETETRSNWGQTVPIPDRLVLRNVKRTYVKVGDHLELPHGSWKRMKAWMDDPAKDVQVRVRDFKKNGAKPFRLSLDSQAAVHAEGELQQWSKGLRLLNIVAQADARFDLAVECNVQVALKTEVFPPQLAIVPNIVDCKVTLKEFALKRVNNVVLDAETAKDIGNELKEYLQQLITILEPDLKKRINEAVTEGLKSGKGPSLKELLR